LRRAHFGLTGLPPTPEEIEAFGKDQRPEAYAELVERLLSSSQYGERWGRHWLDVVRCADTGGFEVDHVYGNAWRYRDYVIRSFNADKPFDRFIQEQIAGGELGPDNPEAVGATALYSIGPVMQESAMVSNQLEYEWLTDIFLFMQGGPSHIDRFDPKPLLARLDGQPLPPSARSGLQLQFTKMDAAIHGCKQTFTRCGRSGLEVADSYPYLQQCADDLAVVRSHQRSPRHRSQVARSGPHETKHSCFKDGSNA